MNDLLDPELNEEHRRPGRKARRNSIFKLLDFSAKGCFALAAISVIYLILFIAFPSAGESFGGGAVVLLVVVTAVPLVLLGVLLHILSLRF